MGKVNVYLPDDLERQVREAGLSVSPICQTALRAAVERLAGARAGDPARGGFTPRLQAVVEDSSARMAAAGRQVTAVDLLGSIITHGENLGARALTMLGVDLPEPQPMQAGTGARGGELADDAREILGAATRIALDMRHAHLGTEHVVIALAGEESPVHDLFTALGISQAAIRRQVERLIANPWSATRETPEASRADLDRLDRELQRLAAELDRLRDAR